MSLSDEGLLKQAEAENEENERIAREEPERARERVERGKVFEAFAFSHKAARHGMTLQEALFTFTSWNEHNGPDKPGRPHGLAPFGMLFDSAIEVYERVGVRLDDRRLLVGVYAHERLEEALGPCPDARCPFKT